MLLTESKRRPPFITILGEPGLGKTTLACMFPEAVVLRIEDGVEAVPAAFKPGLMDKIESTAQLEEQIRWLFAKRKEHGKKTIVLDSITRLETMLEREIVQNDPNRPSSINQACGGFGAGPKALGARHAQIRKLLGHLNEKGDFAIIVIAHSATETVEPPDGDNYTRHTLRLGKHSMAPWVDDVDMVGFIQLQRYVRGAKEGTKNTADKAGKAFSDGIRELITEPRAGNVSKNRFGFKDAIELPDPTLPGAVNVLLPMIPYYVENGFVKAAAVKEEPEEKADETDGDALVEDGNASAQDKQPASDEIDEEEVDDAEPEL